MSGSDKRLIVDSNILIYYLKGIENVQKYFFEFIPVISFIVELEVLSFPDVNEQNVQEIKAFLADQYTIDYLPVMREHVLNIRKQKAVKLPDAIIAATAMHFGLPLVSSDKGFNNIEGLDFIYFEPPNV